MADQLKPTIEVNYQGETHIIPMVRRGYDLTKEDKIEVANMVCHIYGTSRSTMRSVLAKCGIKSQSTWSIWRKEFEEIEKLFIKAAELRGKTEDLEYVEVAKTMLMKHLTGYKETLTERIGHQVQQQPVIGPDGKETPQEPIFVTTAIKQKEIWIRPSLTAAQWVLAIKDPANFKMPTDEDVQGGQMPDGIDVVIMGGSLPPVTDESEIHDIIDTRQPNAGKDQNNAGI